MALREECENNLLLKDSQITKLEKEFNIVKVECDSSQKTKDELETVTIPSLRSELAISKSRI